MDERQLTRGINYMWNDVAGLLDETSSFFICKTMVKLPGDKPSIREILQYDVKEITKELVRNSENKIVLKGDVCFEINYLGEETQDEEILLFNIPYEGATGQVLDRMVEPRINYVNCQSVGLDNILIETVIGLEGVADLSRGAKGVVERFEQDKYIRLPDEWPGIQQLISMQVQHHLNDAEVVNEHLVRLTGMQEVRMLYVGDNRQGDKVILHREINPFERLLNASEERVDLQDIQVSNQMITAQIVDTRGIAVDGRYVVLANGDGLEEYVEPEREEKIVQQVEEDDLPQATDEEDLASRFEHYMVEQNNDEVVLDEPQVVEGVEDEVEPEIKVEEVPPVVQREKTIKVKPKKVEVVEVEEPIVEEEPAVKRTVRQSRRDRLNKYMRDLDSGVSNVKDGRKG